MRRPYYRGSCGRGYRHRLGWKNQLWRQYARSRAIAGGVVAPRPAVFLTLMCPGRPARADAPAVMSTWIKGDDGAARDYRVP
jgi:hypothetical protein